MVNFMYILQRERDRERERSQLRQRKMQHRNENIDRTEKKSTKRED